MERTIFKNHLFFILAVLLVTLCSVEARALDLNGFAEGAYGYRTGSDTTKRDSSNLLEGRFQLKGAHSPEVMEEWSPELTFKADLLIDGYKEDVELIVREAALSFTTADVVDVKLGRQVLTWGTGDLLFINDLFPKDYVSFFTGRDDEYLKIPSDAVRVSLFADMASFDIVVIPVMEPNNSVTGERISFYDGLSGTIAGSEADREFIEPARTLENTELAFRSYRTVGSYEVALYLFRGFYKQPRGILDAAQEQFFYPRLNVYGLSLRGPLFGGIGNFEAGYYDSSEDRVGTDPLIENSSAKYLLGYSRDLGSDLSAGFQYQVEQMLDYASYRAGLGPGEPTRDELRHLVTMRLMKLFKSQTIETGLFLFYSPSDRDAYLRPSVGYKVTDNWKTTAGANIFLGSDDHTEFGQFERNDNLYMRVRYNF
ncbi:MAG: hypothetical protein GY721_07615 [Deltaproteobacteria bacterium]|nr:hypothetical protein [Deltaproteobacteria bacterium]